MFILLEKALYPGHGTSSEYRNTKFEVRSQAQIETSSLNSMLWWISAATYLHVSRWKEQTQPRSRLLLSEPCHLYYTRCTTVMCLITKRDYLVINQWANSIVAHTKWISPCWVAMLTTSIWNYCGWNTCSTLLYCCVLLPFLLSVSIVWLLSSMSVVKSVLFG